MRNVPRGRLIRNGNRAPAINRRRGDVNHDPAVNAENDARDARKWPSKDVFVAGQFEKGRQASGTFVCTFRAMPFQSLCCLVCRLEKFGITE